MPCCASSVFFSALSLSLVGEEARVVAQRQLPRTRRTPRGSFPGAPRVPASGGNRTAELRRLREGGCISLRLVHIAGRSGISEFRRDLRVMKLFGKAKPAAAVGSGGPNSAQDALQALNHQEQVCLFPALSLPPALLPRCTPWSHN